MRLITAVKNSYASSFAGALLALGGLLFTTKPSSMNTRKFTLLFEEVQCGKSMLTRAVLSTMGVCDR